MDEGADEDSLESGKNPAAPHQRCDKHSGDYRRPVWPEIFQQAVGQACKEEPKINSATDLQALRPSLSPHFCSFAAIGADINVLPALQYL